MSAQPSTPVPAAAAPPPSADPHTPVNLLLTELYPSPTNPRKAFDKASLDELAQSIKTYGVLQPILVRLNPRKASDKAQYEIVVGESRWRASQAAGRELIPAIARKLTDGQVIEIQLEENLRRKELHPLDEAEGYRALTAPAIGHSIQHLMARFNRTEVYIKDRLRLLSLVNDAQQLFRSGRILIGHAVALARLGAKDQERAINPNPQRGDRTGGLWEGEHVVWEDEKARKEDPYHGLKAVSVRELEGWIADNVRFDTAAAIAQQPELFPETVRTVTAARQVREKVISITHDFQVPPELKTNERVYGPMSWKQADGKGKHKACDSAVTGVIVVGRGRGQAFKVCIDKEGCKTHWSQWQRERKERQASSGAGASARAKEDRAQKREDAAEAKEKEVQRRWEKATPALAAAAAAIVKKMPVKTLTDFLISNIDEHRVKAAQKFLPRGSSADEFLRYLVFLDVYGELDGSYKWMRERFADSAKEIGLAGIDKIVDAANPAPTEQKPADKPAQAAAAKKGKKK